MIDLIQLYHCAVILLAGCVAYVLITRRNTTSITSPNQLQAVHHIEDVPPQPADTDNHDHPVANNSALNDVRAAHQASHKKATAQDKYESANVLAKKLEKLNEDTVQKLAVGDGIAVAQGLYDIGRNVHKKVKQKQEAQFGLLWQENGFKFVRNRINKPFDWRVLTFGLVEPKLESFTLKLEDGRDYRDFDQTTEQRRYEAMKSAMFAEFFDTMYKGFQSDPTYSEGKLKLHAKHYLTQCTANFGKFLSVPNQQDVKTQLNALHAQVKKHAVVLQVLPADQ